MKAGIYVAIALLLGAILANVLASDPGYVAIRVAGRLIEMSGITFVLALIALYFVVRLLLRAYKARALWRAAQQERRRERARKALARAILEMAQGEWETAESTATRYIGDSEYPMAHYLIAARAAELQGSATRRDEWLARALDLPAESHAPALIMQAELLLKHNQLQAAEAALEQLDSRGEQNARGLLLLARIHHQTGDWKKLEQLEPRLRATRGIPTSGCRRNGRSHLYRSLERSWRGARCKCARCSMEGATQVPHQAGGCRRGLCARGDDVPRSCQRGEAAS
jgi:Uncharacterized enzyme of heme biosynthesis